MSVKAPVQTLLWAVKITNLVDASGALASTAKHIVA